MSGKRYLLDTNAIIQFLAGNASMQEIVANADFLAISVISQLEFFSYPELTEDEERAFFEFISDLAVYDIRSSDVALARETASMRTACSLKLPDAIIAATALVNGCDIVTNDTHFRKQSRVAVKTYSMT